MSQTYRTNVTFPVSWDFKREEERNRFLASAVEIGTKHHWDWKQIDFKKDSMTLDFYTRGGYSLAYCPEGLCELAQQFDTYKLTGWTCDVLNGRMRRFESEKGELYETGVEEDVYGEAAEGTQPVNSPNSGSEPISQAGFLDEMRNL
jgi:hypothetical protein